MRQVSAPGHDWHPHSPPAGSQVMRVYTVTIIDETRNNGHHLLGAVQQRRGTAYDRFARAVASITPPLINVRL